MPRLPTRRLSRSTRPKSARPNWTPSAAPPARRRVDAGRGGQGTRGGRSTARAVDAEGPCSTAAETGATDAVRRHPALDRGGDLGDGIAERGGGDRLVGAETRPRPARIGDVGAGRAEGAEIDGDDTASSRRA